MEAIRQQLGVEKLTLFGISYGTELAIAYARAYPAARRAADPRLRRRRRRPRPVRGRRTSARWARRCARCARPLPRHLRRPGGGPGQARRAAAAASRCGRSPTTRSGRSHRVKIGAGRAARPDVLTDYVPPLRALVPGRGEGRAGRRRRAARPPDPRGRARYDDLGSPRDFSTARYATICETTPLPWDPGTPIDQRPAVTQQRIAALPAERVRAVRPAGRRRGRDRPLPALAGRPAPARDRRAAAVSRRCRR